MAANTKRGRRTKEKWVRIWPPLKVVDDPNLFTIEESGCDECKNYFGWVNCRAGQYQTVDIILSGSRFAVGFWRQDVFTVLGWYSDRSTAEKAAKHLRDY